MNGILNVNKPRDMTSFSVVAIVKRLSGERRVGHAGTLDPQATGVLPVCLGQATRVVEYLFEYSKTYRAEIELGVTTDTYDAWGKVTRRSDPSGIKQEQVLTALAPFVGLIQQTPPMFSAVKQGGEPLYKLARAGAIVERKSREARVYSIRMIDWRPPLFTLEVECGKGTYIRSLAYDLGQVLGCGASLNALSRLKYGPFEIEDALSLAQLEEAFKQGYQERFIHPLDSVLTNYEAITVGEDAARTIRNGVPLDLDAGNIQKQAGNRCRVYTGDGYFLGVLRFDAESGKWLAEKIFNSG